MEGLSSAFTVIGPTLGSGVGVLISRRGIVGSTLRGLQRAGDEWDLGNDFLFKSPLAFAIRK